MGIFILTLSGDKNNWITSCTKDNSQIVTRQNYYYSLLRKTWVAFKFSAELILPLGLMIIPNPCLRKLFLPNFNSITDFSFPQPRPRVFTNLVETPATALTQIRLLMLKIDRNTIQVVPKENNFGSLTSKSTNLLQVWLDPGSNKDHQI